MSRRLHSFVDRNRSSLKLIAHRNSIRAIVDGLIRLLGRCNGGIVNKVNLVTMIQTVNIVTNSGSEGETKGFSLLTRSNDTRNTSNQICFTVILLKLLRIGVALDRSSISLCRSQNCIFNIVGPKLISFSATSVRRNSRKTIPLYTVRVRTSLRIDLIQNATIITGLEISLAGFVPIQYEILCIGHFLFLLPNYCIHIVIQIVCFIRSIKVDILEMVQYIVRKR